MKEWDALNGNPNGNGFAVLFNDKYNVVKPYGKPITAELGVSGLPDYKCRWLAGAFQSLGNYPLLRGIVYFNSFNISNAGKGNEPDFRIGANIIWSVDDVR